MSFQNCPQHDLLANYVNGDMLEETANAILTHLSSCGNCQRQVDRLAHQGDSIIRHLRQPAVSAVVVDSPTVNRLLANAAQIVSPSARRTVAPLVATASKSPSGAVPFEVFIQELKNSGLMSQDEIYQAMLQVSTRNVQEFAIELVNRRKLTLYQAGLIARGKSRGLVLGNYVVLEKVGQGGMGMVFKARHSRMERIVALKILPSSAMKSEQNVQRFYREVKTAGRLNHENIVVAHDAGEVEGVHFLVMEYVDGSDLSRIVKTTGALPVEQAVDCMLQAAKGLASAHDMGIIHRDIKPQNLLRDNHGIVKVLDMGLARLDHEIEVNSGADLETMAHEDLTKTGAVMGTVDYMAPEQADNSKGSDARSDIYSLGCTLFFVLTGRAMYGGETILEKLIAHRVNAIPSIQQFRSDVPNSLATVFQRMVAKRPEDRYQSMKDVIADLQTLGSGSAKPAAPPVVAEPLEELVNLADLESAFQHDMATPLSISFAPNAFSFQDTYGSTATVPAVPTASIPMPTRATLQSPRLRKQPKDYLPVLVAGAATILILAICLFVAYKFTAGAVQKQLLVNGGAGRVAIVLPEVQFYDYEFQSVRDALVRQNMKVDVATPTGKQATPKSGGAPLDADLSLANLRAGDYDAIVFCGGDNMDAYQKDKPSVDSINKLLVASEKLGRPVYSMGEGKHAFCSAKPSTSLRCVWSGDEVLNQIAKGNSADK